MIGDLEPIPGRRRRAGRREWMSGIRPRVLAIALIPAGVIETAARQDDGLSAPGRAGRHETRAVAAP